jgi:hypothetical protein
MRPPEAIALGLIDAAVSPTKAVGDFIAELDKTGVEEPDPEEDLEDESMAELTPAERAAIATEERQRISGIVNHENAKGRTKLAQHLAHETDFTVEQAAGIMAAAETEKEADPAAAPANSGKADEGKTEEDGTKKDPAETKDENKDPADPPAKQGEGDSAKGKSQFEQAMDGGKHPEVGANGGTSGEGEDRVAAILKSQELATGRKPRA